MRFYKPKKGRILPYRRKLYPKGYAKVRAKKDVQIIKEKRKYEE